VASGADRTAQADKTIPPDVADGIRVHVRDAVLERPRTRRDLVVVAVGLHVRRDGHEQLGTRDRERARRLGELDVETDQRRDETAGERHETKLVAPPKDPALAREKPRLSVHRGKPAGSASGCGPTASMARSTFACGARRTDSSWARSAFTTGIFASPQAAGSTPAQAHLTSAGSLAAGAAPRQTPCRHRETTGRRP